MCEVMQSERERGREEERVFVFKSHLVLFIGQPLPFKRC